MLSAMNLTQRNKARHYFEKDRLTAPARYQDYAYTVSHEYTQIAWSID